MQVFAEEARSPRPLSLGSSHSAVRLSRIFKKAMKSKYGKLLDKGEIFEQVLWKLMNDEPLPLTFRDHQLRNNLEGKRECHLRPVFLLIYWYEGDDLLVLDRIGTHSELLGL